MAAGCAIAAALLTVAPVQLAQADDATQPDPLASLASVAPATLQDVAQIPTTTSGDTALSLTTSTGSVVVPTDPTDGIQLTGTAAGVSSDINIGLPFSSSADNADALTKGIAAYDNNNDSVTVPVVKDDGSVEINTIIASALAPTSYAYPLALPAGNTLALDDKGGVGILDSNGSWVAGIAPAWARDASGAAVPTRYTIAGAVVTQSVDLSSPSITYPVVADPWFGNAIISRTAWTNDGPYSPTLSVFPTTYGRTVGMGGYLLGGPVSGLGYEALVGAAAWSEALSKTARQGHPNPDTDSMSDQFYCHWYAVRIREPKKTSWNLDSKRPHVGLAATIAKSCNPT